MTDYELTADSCPDGPCPRMARNPHRQTVALQGYDPLEDLDPVMRTLPPQESRIEMPSAVLLDMLAEHLSDEEIDSLLARRAARVAV